VVGGGCDDPNRLRFVVDRLPQWLVRVSQLEQNDLRFAASPRIIVRPRFESQRGYK